MRFELLMEAAKIKEAAKKLLCTDVNYRNVTLTSTVKLPNLEH